MNLYTYLVYKYIKRKNGILLTWKGRKWQINLMLNHSPSLVNINMFKLYKKKIVKINCLLYFV